MVLKFYNTLTRQEEDFKALKEGSVSMYTCGPTVYNYAHIGNLRSYFLSDIVRRSLELAGYQVKQVINITDVGHLSSDADTGLDKVEEEAKKENKKATDIAEFYTQAFYQDLKDLNIKTDNTIFPKASEHIAEQINLIKKLEEKGFTYKTSDGIYFDSQKFPDYGRLANLDIAGLKAGARVESSVDKKNPTDFALWKFSKPEEKRQQEWSSPWGVGFPGWHIECSAMSMKYLGDTFDIHTGGIDHIPVHHTNEIAQSESVTGKKFVNLWLHNEFLVSTDEQKMSKSKKNFLTLSDLKKQGFSPLSYRYLLLNAHYRKPLNFSNEAITSADNAYHKLKNILEDLPDSGQIIKEYADKFKEFIFNDLKTPQALALLWDLISDSKQEPADKKSTILFFDQILGLNLGQKENIEIPSKIKELVEKREKFRQLEDFRTADKIRRQIEESGYTVLDGENGPKIKKI